jgi:glycosyltransferase involved in cell wall biosynthesis
LKALHFGRFYHAGYGGMERVVALLLKGLSRTMEVANLVANERYATEVVEAEGYRVYKVPTLAMGVGAVLCPTMPLWARRLDRQHRFDIAHLHFPDPMSHLAAAALPARVKTVISWHSDIIRQKRTLQLYRPFLDRLVARADAIVAATPAHFSSSSQLSACRDPARLHVVPYGIDFGPFEAPQAAQAGAKLRRSWGRRFAIFAVGRHVYYKGFEFLIRAMRDVRTDAMLVLGSTGPLSDGLKRLAAESGVAERVIFAGRIPEEDLPAHYHAADVYCLSSVEPSEAFGLVQVEAMACHKPVISCELNNGVTYVNQNGVTGIVVPPRDPAALAGAINRLLEDEALRLKLGQAGYERAKREFTLERMWSGMLEVYRNVLARG